MSLRKLLILRAFAMDYHSGQWSRGYKILSMTYQRLQKNVVYANMSTGLMRDYWIQCARNTKLYKELVEKYGEKI